MRLQMEKKDKFTKFNVSSSRPSVRRYSWSSTPDWKLQLTSSCQDQFTKWWLGVVRWCHSHEAEDEVVYSVNSYKRRRIFQFAFFSFGSWFTRRQIFACTKSEERTKDKGTVSSKLNKVSTLHFVSIISCHLLRRSQRLNGKNIATEVLTLEINCNFAFLFTIRWLANTDIEVIGEYTSLHFLKQESCTTYSEKISKNCMNWMQLAIWNIDTTTWTKCTYRRILCNLRCKNE